MLCGLEQLGIDFQHQFYIAHPHHDRLYLYGYVQVMKKYMKMRKHIFKNIDKLF